VRSVFSEPAPTEVGRSADETQNIVDIFRNSSDIFENSSDIPTNFNDILSFFRAIADKALGRSRVYAALAATSRFTPHADAA
jgi:hypothetical protein